MRWLNHLFTTRWHVQRVFAPAALDAIEHAVSQSEQRHRGELRIAVEAAFDLPQLLRALTPRQRALQVFAELGVWDTEENNGVLVFVLLAERSVEVIADRGYATRVQADEWQSICASLANQCAQGNFSDGLLQGIEALTVLMARAFPGEGRDPNELPNRPQLI